MRRIKERVLLRLVFVLGEDRRVFSCVRSPRRMIRVDIFYYEIVPLFFVALQRRFTRRARAFPSCQTGIAYIGFLCYFVAEERERERSGLACLRSYEHSRANIRDVDDASMIIAVQSGLYNITWTRDTTVQRLEQPGIVVSLSGNGPGSLTRIMVRNLPAILDFVFILSLQVVDFY